jgi:hypothetical protein
MSITTTKRQHVNQNEGMLTSRQFHDVLDWQQEFKADVVYVGPIDYTDPDRIHHVSAGNPGIPYPKEAEKQPDSNVRLSTPAPIPAPTPLPPVTAKQAPAQAPKADPRIYKLPPELHAQLSKKPANVDVHAPEKRTMLPGPRAAAAMLEGTPGTPAATAVTKSETKYDSIGCDISPNFAKQGDAPDFIGKVTLGNKLFYIGAWENEQKNKRQPAYIIKFSRNFAAGDLIHRSHKVGYKSFRAWIMDPPEAGVGANFHSWLKGAANSLISRRFEVFTGRRITQRRAEVILKALSKKAKADLVRPATWRQDVFNTVANVFAQRGKGYIDRGNEDGEHGDVILDTELMLKLAPTYSRAQAIADSPVKYYAHSHDEPNHCQEALSTLFMELQAHPGELTLVFVQLNDRGGMDFVQGGPEDGSTYPWVVPHLMHVKGGRTGKGNGHRSKKCDDAVAIPCYGAIEFDWRNTDANPELKSFLDQLDADGISYKDAQAAIIWHLRQYGKLAMVVDSGGKSLHAWFNIRGVPREDWLKFRDYAVSLGADHDGSGLSQQFRTPDGQRTDKNGERQRTLYFNPAAINGSLTTTSPRQPVKADFLF